VQIQGGLMNIYVGNLSYDLTVDELKEVFTKNGDVTTTNIITDKFTGKSKGFGFVEMPSKEEALEAIKNLDGYALKGRNLKVNEAKPKPQRTERKSW